MKKKWKKVLAFVVGGSLLLLLLAPTIAARTGLLHGLINRYSGLNGRIEYDAASVGWFSQTKFKNLMILDSDGNVAARVNEVTLSKSLSGLIFSGTTGAKLSLSQCEVILDRQRKQYNWQKLLPEKSSAKESKPVTLQVSVEELQIFLRENGDPKGKLDNCNVGIVLRSSEQNSSDQFVEFNLSTGPQLKVQGELDITNSGSLSRLDSTLEATNADVSAFNSILNHLSLPTTQAILNGQAGIHWIAQEQSNSIDFEFGKLSIAQPNAQPILDGYPMVPLTLDGSLHLNSPKESQLAIESEYGALQFKGQIPGAGKGVLQDIIQTPCKFEGHFDLARFATDYPQWVQVKNGVELQNGNINFVVFNRLEGDRQRVLVDVRSDALKARYGEQNIEWKNPILLSCALSRPAADDSAPVEIEFIQCQSEFLNAQGSGGFEQSGSQGKLTINGDLSLLKQKLDSFFEFATFQLAGKVTGDLTWKTSPQDQNPKSFQMDGNSTISGFEFGFADDSGWHEKLVTLLFSSNCRYVDGSLSQLQKLESKLQIDDDLASFVLRKPVEFKDKYQSIFDVVLSGSSKRWMSRINSLFDVGFDLTGQAGITAVVSSTPNVVRIRSRQFSLRPFRFQASSLLVDESNAKGQIDLVYSRADGSLKANVLQVTTPNVLVDATSFESSIKDSHRETSANFRLSGNSIRLSRWFLPSSIVAKGAIQGSAKLRVDQKGVHWDADLASEKFGLQKRQGKLPGKDSEFDVIIPFGPAKIFSQGTYLSSKVQLEKTSFAAKRASIDLKGLVDLTGRTSQLDLKGNLNTDLQGLVDLLTPQLKSTVKFVGGQESSFQLQGPVTGSDRNALIPKEWDGLASLSWDRGELFALSLEEGGVDVKLKDAEIAIEPRNVRIAGGELIASTKITLQKEPYRLIVPAGTIVKHAEIAPKVFRTWMRYVTPLLADATEAKGRFSVELDRQSVLPLKNPLAGNVSGKLVIDAMAVGPGPLGQSLISMTQQWLTIIGKQDLIRSVRDKPWLQLPKQEVQISIDGGKVVHQLLQFNIGEVTIYTSGTVDLNQNVDMSVYIPMQADWFKDNAVLKSLAGDAIRIPLKGNLANPKLDLTFLKSLSKRIAIGTVGNLLDEKTGGILNGDLLNNNLLKGNLLKGNDKNGDDKKGKLGKFLEDKTQNLLQKGILKGLERLNNK